MDGEESILSIANFLEATKPVEKVEEAKSGAVISEKEENVRNSNHSESDQKSTEFVAKKVTKSVAAEVVSRKSEKDNVVKCANSSKISATEVVATKTITTPRQTKPVIARKSVPVPDGSQPTPRHPSTAPVKVTVANPLLKTNPTVSKAPAVSVCGTSSPVVTKDQSSDNNPKKPMLSDSQIITPKVRDTASEVSAPSTLPKPAQVTTEPRTSSGDLKPSISIAPTTQSVSQSQAQPILPILPILPKLPKSVPAEKQSQPNKSTVDENTSSLATRPPAPAVPSTNSHIPASVSSTQTSNPPLASSTQTSNPLASSTQTSNPPLASSTQTSNPPLASSTQSNVPGSIHSTQSSIPPPISNASSLPPKPAANTPQGSQPPCPSSLPVSTLTSLTTQLTPLSHLHTTSLLYLSPDSLRNLSDGVQALDLSGETACTDVETLTLHRAVLNIQVLSSELVTWSTTDFMPLTNISCRTLHCHHLQKLVYKEPNLKDIILSKVGEEEFNQFDQLTDFYMGRGDLFICENIAVLIYLYHRIRNLSLKYVLTKLYNVYVKMKPIFKKTSTDPVYNTSVTNLTRLMNAPWDEQVSLSEENGYDFDFLITILMYWKKAKDNPTKASTAEAESSASKPPVQKDVPAESSTSPEPVNNTASDPATKSLKVDTSKSTPTTSVSAGKMKSESKPIKDDLQYKVELLSSVEAPVVEKVSIPDEEAAAAALTSSQVSVLSLHQLKTFLDQSTDPRQRVMKGVGQQAYKEFNNLVTSLQDMSMVIGDTNVKTLYFTIINFANHPVTAEMKKFEPLSNFSLKFEPFQDLKTLLLKDVNIRSIVTKQLGEVVVDGFLQQVDTLSMSGTDFVLTDQEANIVLYHRFRNCVIDNLMARLKVVHSKIQVVQLTNPPPSYTIGVKMLESLMATHYNGQVLMMEKSKFDFDFLTTILEFLQQCKDSEETHGVQEVKMVVVKPVESKTKLGSIISSILIDLADIGLVQGIENMVGVDISREYIALVKAAQRDVENLTAKQRKAIFSLKNAIFFFKNNLKCDDLPLTNLSLEADRFSHLLKFIGKDAGIRNTINEKYGDVALKELETLVTAHDERGDQFISKFVEKNVKLYHSLRNTALEKILRQISVVHGKVKNIDLPEAARNSTQYHIAIKRLDGIVDADFNKKILIIEDLKFEFDFLSTILLVWRTETTKQAEAALKAEEAKKAAEAEKLKNVKPTEVSKVKKESFKPAVVPEVQNQKTVSKGRRIRASSLKVDQVNDDPDDPDAVEADDPNDPDFDLNSIEIIVEDDRAAELDLPYVVPTNAHNSTMVLHSRLTAGSLPGPSTTSASPARPSVQSSGSTIRPVSRTAAPIVPVSTSPPPEVLPLSHTAPLSIATPSNPMPVSPGWGGELPIKTKCTQCPDKTSESVEQLMNHYSFMHCREEIESRYIGEGDNCPACNEEFKLRFNLIKHLGLVHGAVKVDVSQTERWICNFCKKEFLSDEFLRKHLIKLHLEKKFESSFLALSETNEILCQFCEKTFSYKRNLFCHIGVDHDKLPEILPNYNKSDAADDMKCRHCDFESSLTGLKTHYLTTHYKDSFAKLCQEEGLVSPDLSCRYCQVIFSDQDSLVLHIGVDHNRVYRFISHFQGKNIGIISNHSSALNAIAIKVSNSSKKDPAEFAITDLPDPLSTETVFIDTDQDVSGASPIKPQIKIVSPTKLLSIKTSRILKSSNIVSNQIQANNNSPKVSQTKRQRSSSPKSDPKLKRQDTSKWCNRCSKNFLASKYEAHIILKHLNQLAVSELKQEQSLVSCHGLQCPNKTCLQANRFINMESLLVHFITKHSKLLQSKLASSIISKDPEHAGKGVQTKPKTSNNVDLALDISNDSTDFQARLEVKTQESTQVTNSPWVEKFKTFCKISSLPEAKALLDSKFQTPSPIMLDKFLTHLCQTPSIIPQLEEVISGLSSIFSKDPIKTQPCVVRHLLLQDYEKHCSTVGTSMQVCNPMQLVIMLSQLLAKPGVKPEDLEWLVSWISKMHDKVDGRLLIQNKKITDFFEAVGFKLLENVPEQQEKTVMQVKQEVVEKPSFPCDKCGTKFNKRIGLVRHRDRCGDGLVVAKKEDATKDVKRDNDTTNVADAKQVAAKFKAKRISLGLGQKQVLVHMKSLLGPDLKVQTIDVAKFELNHNQQAMTKFLPIAQSWLKQLPVSQTLTSPNHSKAPVQVKTEPAIPTPVQLSTNRQVSTSKLAEAAIPRVDIVKLKLSPSDFTSTIDLATSLDMVQEPREREKLSIKPKTDIIAPDVVDVAAPEILEAQPECIDLDEEDKVYRYFCLECEGCVGSPSCDHTSHPRVPLQFDISTHIAKTGHVAVSPITGFLSMSPMPDLAYSMQHGADVRKQWKDLVLAGSYIPSQFTGVKRCKWSDCREIFEDAVEAFKHIRDTHLKPKQHKPSIPSIPPARSPLRPQPTNPAQKRKSLSTLSSSVPVKKIGRLETNS